MAIGGIEMDIFEKLQKYTDYSLRRSDEKIEIQYMDTAFEGLTFTGYDLNNTRFTKVKFNECDFTDVYLSGSNLSGSTFKHCIFNNNIFRKGLAHYALFENTDLKKLDAFRTSFCDATFNNLLIEDSIIKRCLISDAAFTNVVFRKTDLSDTSFIHSKFTNVKFVECVLNNTKFIDNFVDVLCLEGVEFIDCNRDIDGLLIDYEEWLRGIHNIPKPNKPNNK